MARIDRLKEGIGLRGYSGKDPVIEYKKEAFNAFDLLNQNIKSDVIEKLLKVQIVAPEQAEAMQSMLQAPDMDDLQFHGADESSAGGGVQVPRQAIPTQSAVDAEPAMPQRQRMRMTAAPPRDMPDRPLNRAERRKMDKSKR